MITAEEIKEAHSHRYDRLEGFCDEVVAAVLPVELAERLEVAAAGLARAAGITVEEALSTLANRAVAEYLERMGVL